MILFILAILAFGYLGYRYRGHVNSAFGWVVHETGSKPLAVLSIALALWVALCSFFWLIFPILVYVGLRGLQHRIVELDDSLQECVRRLPAAVNVQRTNRRIETPPPQ